MTGTLVEIAGGIGLFLLGMLTMTDGLRGVAGDALQRTLRRFTRSPVSGAATGTVLTALIQSSSATTVTAVGFAGAGLLTFPEALGVVFGANIGTTFTGWMVATLGFKLQLGVVAPGLVLLGVLLRLFAPRRWARAGLALAGFGLVFLGIHALQAGMAGLGEFVTPERLPGDTLTGRLQLVAIGALVTLVTQSSSAGVALALAAVHAGHIEFAQAAALVIGMDVGTTATAALATVGASLPARRTGWAHVVYNLMTGAAAFAMLPFFAAGLEALAPGASRSNPEFAVVGFHSFFNTVGVLAVLPFARRFATLVERLVPERAGPFSVRLDRSLLAEPDVALRATGPVLADLAGRSCDILAEQLHPDAALERRQGERELLAIAVDEVQHYLGQLSPAPVDGVATRLGAALHVVDQLRRLLHREGQRPRAAALRLDQELRERGAQVAGALERRRGGAPDEAALARLRRELEERRPAFRDELTRRAGAGALEVSGALERMDAYRWLERVTHHAWRVTHHLGQLEREVPARLQVEPEEPA